MSNKPKNAIDLADQEPFETEETVSQQPSIPNSGLLRWKVKLAYVPDTIVEAVNSADAWEKFKAKWGILKSEHAPEISTVETSMEGA